MTPSVTDNPSGGAEDSELDSNGSPQMMTTAFGFSSEEEEDEEEEVGHEFQGYVLLPQESDVIEDHTQQPDAQSFEETDEGEPIDRDRHSPEDEFQETSSVGSAIVSGIPMDQERIDKIKAAMVGFTLPTSAIPPWASVVPEDQWKQYLLTSTGDRGPTLVANDK